MLAGLLFLSRGQGDKLPFVYLFEKSYADESRTGTTDTATMSRIKLGSTIVPAFARGEGKLVMYSVDSCMPVLRSEDDSDSDDDISSKPHWELTLRELEPVRDGETLQAYGFGKATGALDEVSLIYSKFIITDAANYRLCPAGDYALRRDQTDEVAEPDEGAETAFLCPTPMRATSEESAWCDYKALWARRASSTITLALELGQLSPAHAVYFSTNSNARTTDSLSLANGPFCVPFDFFAMSDELWKAFYEVNATDRHAFTLIHTCNKTC